MKSIVRALWTARLLGAVAFLAPPLVLVGRSPLAAPLLVLVLLAEAFGAWALRRYLQAAAQGQDGDVLLANGARVPRHTIRTHHTAERLEHVVGAVAAGIALVAAHEALFSVVVIALVLLVQLLLLVSRYGVWTQHRAFRALMDGRPDETLRRLRAFRRVQGPLGRAIVATQAAALERTGEPAAARRLLESTWEGDLDPFAARIAVARLADGDARLAREWLAADHPPDRYRRYLKALVGGLLALHEGRGAEQVEALRRLRQELPPFQARDLALLEAAGRHQAGEAAGAAAALEALEPLDPDAWRAEAQPALWSVLRAIRTDLPAPGGRAVATAPAETPDAFAAPDAPDLGRPPLLQRLHAGAIPCEQVPLGARDTRFPVVQRVLVGLLVVLAALLAVITGLLALGGALEPLLRDTILTVLALVGFVVALQGGREVLRRRMHRPAEGMRLGDGRYLPRHPPALRWLWTVGPAVSLVILSAVPLVEWALRGSLTSALLVLVFAVLVAISTRQRVAALRAAIAVHEAPVDQVVARVEALPTPSTLGWLALAHVVAGDPEGAEAVVTDAVALVPQLAEIGLWLRAARGAVSLDHLLLRTPDGLGARYRWAVALRLAALQAGEAPRVLPYLDEGTALAEGLPNRFGGLLHQLDRAVLAAAAPDRVEAYEGRHAEGLARGTWVPAAWLGPGSQAL